MNDHWYGCWRDGPGHYECAIEKIRAIQHDDAAVRAAMRDAARYRWLRDEAAMQQRRHAAELNPVVWDRYCDAQMGEDE